MSGVSVCGIAVVNCVYAVLALSAAKRCGVDLSLASGLGLKVLLLGSAAESAIGVYLHTGLSASIVFAFGAAIVGAACDAVCGYVFDAITMPAFLLTCACVLWAGTAAAAAEGAVAAAGVLGILYVITCGRGVGLGDVKLAACIGAGIGVAGGLEALGVAFVSGGAYAAYVLLAKRARRGDELCFAPYLAAGMAVAILHGARV